MTRSTFGGTAADVVIARGPGGVARLVPATLTFWTGETGDTQVTDLLFEGGAVAQINVPVTGQVPAFLGPDNVTELWADGGGGRVRMVAEGRQGPVGPSGGPLPDMTGVPAGQVPVTTGAGAAVYVNLAATIAAQVAPAQAAANAAVGIAIVLGA